jgi:hypothetical protein
VAATPTVEEEDAADAAGLLEDVRRLRAEVTAARAELRRGRRAGTLKEMAAAEEDQRLVALEREVELLEAKVGGLAAESDAALAEDAQGALGKMIEKDLGEARALAGQARELEARLTAAADGRARASLDALYADTRRVLDKAKLGKIDAVIGQKRVLDIAVQDLASGRYPPELHGRLWEAGLIGDDEEYWPPEGELWKDEYEGWR